MESCFHLDLEKYPLEKVYEKICSGRIYKSRKVLTVDAKENFEKLNICGIINCKEFLNNVSTKGKLSRLSDKVKISEEYLVMLKREISSFLVKPVNFSAIPEIDNNLVEELKKTDILHTKHFFDLSYSKKLRSALKRKLGISNKQITELLNMSDLSRINGFGPIFIRLNIDAGIKSSKQFAETDVEDIDSRTKKINAEKSLTKIWPKLFELEICRDYAKVLPDVIE